MKHLYRLKRHHSTELPPRHKKPCKVEGCVNPCRSSGLCNMHRLRLKIHGEVGEALPRKGLGGTGSVSKTTGYKYFYRPKHPNASAVNGNIAEHVLVMSQILGRPLRKGESVHHKNGIKADNSPANLELRTSGKHPNGQSLQDMIEYCAAYLQMYAPDHKILSEIYLNNLPV